MTKQRRNALMSFILTVLYSLYQTSKTAEEITPYSKVLSLALPVIAVIFALNEKQNSVRWTLITLEVLLFLFMLFIALHS